ncbi:MAG: hypothetical protein FWB85_08670 [Chitinispirillia bacterium]|nr:hypothetical protein [Chitinispirillia bacterium]MCL2242321.1 hypothetical protein [Chitinispirillia bacterium]
MKAASIYVRNSHFYIVPLASIIVGVYVGVEPVVVIADTVSDETLGQNILDTVALPVPKVPKPESSAEWTQYGKPLLKAAKVRSWKAFMDGSQLINIEQDVDGMIELLPTVNNGKSFSHRPKNIQVLSSDCTPAELGKAVRHLFQEIIDAARVQIPLGRTFKKNR